MRRSCTPPIDQLRGEWAGGGGGGGVCSGARAFPTLPTSSTSSLPSGYPHYLPIHSGTNFLSPSLPPGPVTSAYQHHQQQQQQQQQPLSSSLTSPHHHRHQLKARCRGVWELSRFRFSCLGSSLATMPLLRASRSSPCSCPTWSLSGWVSVCLRCERRRQSDLASSQDKSHFKRIGVCRKRVPQRVLPLAQVLSARIKNNESDRNRLHIKSPPKFY